MVKSKRKIRSDLDAHEVRTILLDDLNKEAIGPRWGEDEELEHNPQSLYLTGMLYPQSYDIQIDEVESHVTSESDEGTGTNSVNKNFTSPKDNAFITLYLGLPSAVPGGSCIQYTVINTFLTINIR